MRTRNGLGLRVGKCFLRGSWPGNSRPGGIQEQRFTGSSSFWRLGLSSTDFLAPTFLRRKFMALVSNCSCVSSG